MRLEHIPILVGLAVGLVGVLLIADAWLADDFFVAHERRRRQRAERNRGGEAIVGLGALCMSAAFIGRDTWRYGTLSVLAGTLLLAAGIGLNWRFLHELLFFRGPARRAEREKGLGEEPKPASEEARPASNERPTRPARSTPTPPERLRIR